MALIYGPFWSRRLGWTLGIGHLGPKRCSFDCSHCLAGRTQQRTLRRAATSAPEAVVERLGARLAEIDLAVEHLLIAPDGEPTLDRALGANLEQLQRFARPVLVRTNGTLLSRDDVRAELCAADAVDIVLDAASEQLWRTVHRPAAGLRRALVVQGMRVFAAGYRGRLSTLTTLRGGVNTARSELEALADLVSSLQPAVAFLTVAGTGAAAELAPADEGLLARAEAIFSQRFGRVERLDAPPAACCPRRALPRVARAQAAC